MFLTSPLCVSVFTRSGMLRMMSVTSREENKGGKCGERGTKGRTRIRKGGVNGNSRKERKGGTRRR